MRGDLQAGIIAATVANANRDPDKKRDAFEATDFMPNFDQEESKPKAMNGADTLALMRLWFPPMQEGGDLN